MNYLQIDVTLKKSLLKSFMKSLITCSVIFLENDTVLYNFKAKSVSRENRSSMYSQMRRQPDPPAPLKTKKKKNDGYRYLTSII